MFEPVLEVAASVCNNCADATPPRKLPVPFISLNFDAHASAARTNNHDEVSSVATLFLGPVKGRCRLIMRSLAAELAQATAADVLQFGGRCHINSYTGVLGT